ncbi:MAG: zinc-binding dehydrogenase, partial [Gammaproteobacteria bacterium]
GVGSIAVTLLAKLGFTVHASTGKQSCHQWLQQLGASEIVDRNELIEVSAKPMLKPRWAAAVDVVGGATLFNVVKSILPGGSVACCGLVGSPMFEASVFPFILRGVNLLGVDSVEIPLADKQETWRRLGAEWRLDGLDQITTEIGLDELGEALQSVLQGKAQGRYLLNLQQ